VGDALTNVAKADRFSADLDDFDYKLAVLSE